MSLLLASLAVLLVSAVAALTCRRSDRLASQVGSVGVVVAAGLGLVPALRMLAGGRPEAIHVPWAVPYGEFFLELDAMSAWFLVPTFVVSAAAAVYGVGYLAGSRSGKPLATVWCHFNLLVAALVLVFLARNAVLFLVAWEVMAVASFFLVMFDDDRAEVRRAGWIYLVATHCGTAFLIAFFLGLGRGSGALDFDLWARAPAGPPAGAGVLFLLAVVGFGAKAGFLPLHVWLPEAHPAAPSHVSAVMSGVMIKTGVYGLLRALTFLGPPAAWWGWTLVLLGLAGALAGIAFAAAQSDLKRLLAYSSVENMGILTVGLGLGLLGVSQGQPALAALGFGGALLHVLNHALFKGLLFLGAGSVLHGTGVRSLDRLGGLLRRMPWTGLTFLVGGLALCGLPPFNGFVSEWLLFLGAYRAVTVSDPVMAVAGAFALAGLGLVGGLAAAMVARSVGAVFLGEPRSEAAAQAHEAGAALRWPMVVLAAGCALIPLAAPWLVRAQGPILEVLTEAPVEALGGTLSATASGLQAVAGVGLTFIPLAGLVGLLRYVLLRNRPAHSAVTWDCGYARPTARMQYTASSFAQPFTRLFGVVLRGRAQVTPPAGLFPAQAGLATETPDPAQTRLYEPLFRGVARGLGRLRWIQHGKVQVYVLYIALTLLVLLLWKLR